MASDARHESAAGLSGDRAEHGDVALSATDQCDRTSPCWRASRRTRRVRARFGYRRLHILLERDGLLGESQARPSDLSSRRACRCVDGGGSG